MGLIDRYPDVARNGIRLAWAKMIEMLGGRSVHQRGPLPDGVRDAGEREVAARSGAGCRRHWTSPGWRSTCSRMPSTTSATKRPCTATFPPLPRPCHAGGRAGDYDGLLRVVDSDGNVLEQAWRRPLPRILGEAVEPWISEVPGITNRRRCAETAAGGAVDITAGMYRVGFAGPAERLRLRRHRAPTPTASFGSWRSRRPVSTASTTTTRA